MSTDPSLMRAILLSVSFLGNDMSRVQGAFLMVLLRGDADAGVLPSELFNGDLHLAGMACASLRAQGIIESVGRVKSSNPLANGRRVSLWRIPANKVNTARTWLSRNGYVATEAEQLSLAV